MVSETERERERNTHFKKLTSCAAADFPAVEFAAAGRADSRMAAIAAATSLASHQQLCCVICTRDLRLHVITSNHVYNLTQQRY